MNNIKKKIFFYLIIDWTVGVLIKDSKLSGQKTYQGLMYFCYGKFGFLIISIFQFIFAYGGKLLILILILIFKILMINVYLLFQISNNKLISI